MAGLLGKNTPLLLKHKYMPVIKEYIFKGITNEEGVILNIRSDSALVRKWLNFIKYDLELMLDITRPDRVIVWKKDHTKFTLEFTVNLLRYVADERNTVLRDFLFLDTEFNFFFDPIDILITLMYADHNTHEAFKPGKLVGQDHWLDNMRVKRTVKGLFGDKTHPNPQRMASAIRFRNTKRIFHLWELKSPSMLSEGITK